jgi:hypothetical protein
MTIPASSIVSVNPSVLSAGGNPLALNGLILSQSAVLPSRSALSFPSSAAVATYFGSTSVEAKMASAYFAGYKGATQLPNALLFYRYAAAATSAFLRGARNVSTLAALNLISAGSLSVTVDNVLATSSAIDLSPATSMAQVASLIATAIGETVTYDTDFNAFVITSGTTGATSTITEATGTVATALSLTSALGAVLSQGEGQTTPAEAMAAVVLDTQNWVSFSTTFEPSLDDAKAFAEWTSFTNGRYLFAAWDTDITATQTPSSFAGLGKYLKDNDLSGTALVWYDPALAGFLMGAIASMDFGRRNARITLAFKSSRAAIDQVTSIAQVTDLTVAENLLANGYNFYGVYATANDQFVYFYNGQISGEYNFIDSYVNAIWFTNQCQLALMDLLTNVGSIPYNPSGYGLIKAALQDPINQALNFGAMRAGVSLSASQTAQVNSAAGVDISDTLSARGWYVQVLDPGAQARAARTSPNCTVWYMDGQAVQKITVASIDVL